MMHRWAERGGPLIGRECGGMGYSGGTWDQDDE